MLQHKKGSGSSGAVGFLALQNEFTKIFMHIFIECFCWEGDEFYADISTNVVKYKVRYE